MEIDIDIPCPKLPEIPDIPSISVVGGAELKAFLNFAEGTPTDCKLYFNLFLQLGPLLAASACLMKILEVMGKLMEFFDAASSANLPKIGTAAGDMVKALEALIPCIPPLSPINIAIMIKGMLELVINFFSCFLSQLRSILEFQATIDLSMSEGNPVLRAQLECARDNADTSLDNLLKSLEPLQPILGSVTSLGGVAGLSIPELPDLSNISLEGGADGAITSVEEAIGTMRQVIESLPL